MYDDEANGNLKLQKKILVDVVVVGRQMAAGVGVATDELKHKAPSRRQLPNSYRDIPTPPGIG